MVRSQRVWAARFVTSSELHASVPAHPERTERPLRILYVTSEWPDEEFPYTSPFITDQVEFLRRAGVEVDVFAFRGRRNPLNYLKAWMQVRHGLDPSRYDLVHTSHGQAGLLPWPRRLPVVATFWGSDILGDRYPDGRMRPGGRFLQRACWLIALVADGVIIVSNAMRQHLPASVEPLLLPTAVDLDSVPTISPQAARRSLGLPKDERLVLFAGNPETIEKRYDLASAAVEILNERLPARLFLGWGRSHQEILVLMRACDVLLVSSLQEGSPTIVKEALACKLPVVSVPVGDVDEQIGGVEGCELCGDDRPETIAAALERVLRRRQRLTGNHVAHVDHKVLADRLIAFYRSVLDEVPRDVVNG